MLFIFSIGWSMAQMSAHSRTLVTSSVICGYASLDRTCRPCGCVSRGLEKRVFRDQAARSGARVVGRTGGPVLGFSDRHLDSSTFGCDDRAVWWIRGIESCPVITAPHTGTLLLCFFKWFTHDHSWVILGSKWLSPSNFQGSNATIRPKKSST